jgi:hypothetical protein
LQGFPRWLSAGVLFAAGRSTPRRARTPSAPRSGLPGPGADRDQEGALWPRPPRTPDAGGSRGGHGGGAVLQVRRPDQARGTLGPRSRRRRAGLPRRSSQVVQPKRRGAKAARPPLPDPEPENFVRVWSRYWSGPANLGVRGVGNSVVLARTPTPPPPARGATRSRSTKRYLPQWYAWR